MDKHTCGKGGVCRNHNGSIKTQCSKIFKKVHKYDSQSYKHKFIYSYMNILIYRRQMIALHCETLSKTIGRNTKQPYRGGTLSKTVEIVH